MPTAETVSPEAKTLTFAMRQVMHHFKKHPRQVICDLSAEGRDDAEIADELGISQNTLKYWISYFEIKASRTKRYTTGD